MALPLGGANGVYRGMLATVARLLQGSVLALLVLQAGTARGEEARHSGRPDGRTGIDVAMDDGIPPYGFRDEAGHLQGIVVDRWRLWQEHTGIPVRLHAMDWASAIRALDAGQVDVVDTLSATPEREARYVFSAPYADLGVRLFFHESLRGIADARSTRGIPVGVKEGGTCDARLVEQGRPDAGDVRRFPGYHALLDAVAAGEIRVFCMHETPARYYLRRQGLAGEFRETAPLYLSQLQWAVPRRDVPLARVVADGFDAITPAEAAGVEERWRRIIAPVDPPSPRWRYATAAAAVLVVAVGLLAALALALRGRVRARTAELSRALAELKESKHAAEDALRRLEEVLEAVPDLLFEIDGGGRLVDFKSQREDLLPASRTALRGRAVADFLSPDAGGTLREALRAATASGSDYGRLIEVDAAGGAKWFELSVARKEPRDGGASTFIVLARDVTRRIRAEQAIAAERWKMEAIVQTALDGFWIVGTDARILEVNDAICAMLGYPRDELIGMRIHDVEAAMDPQEIAGRMQAIVERGHLQFSSRQRRKDGTVIGVEVSAHYVPADGTVVSFQRDVTRRLRVEEQLRQSQKMQAIGLLAGGIAHDFNNLLTTIQIAGDFSLRAAPPEGQLHDDIAAMCLAARKGQEVTKQLLAFSRRQVLEPRVSDLNALVRDSEQLLRRFLAGRVHVELRLAPDACYAFVDPGQIQQVVLNLVINARDAMPNGGSLTVETANVEIPAGDEAWADASFAGPGVRIAVEDTGTGIDPKVLPRIFDPFFTTKPVGKGTGLGLAIALGTVEQSGGFIRVRSEPGKGTRFEIHFPRAAEAPQDGAPAPAPAPGPGSSETVVVVEDDDRVRALTTRVLERAGFDVIAASSLDDAVERLRAHASAPAILVTDVHMPDHSGAVVAAALEARVPGLRTLYMSGFPKESLVEDGLLRAGDRFVRKPFTAETLVRSVREVLDA